MGGLFPMSAPVKILPVLTWQESRELFRLSWPNSPEYLRTHAHRHAGCGHIVTCAWGGTGEPCQAYETQNKVDLCTDCAVPGLELLGSWCADWWLPRELRGEPEPRRMPVYLD